MTEMESTNQITVYQTPDGKTYKTHTLLPGLMSGEVRVKLRQQEAGI